MPPTSFDNPLLSIAWCAQAACIIEATARKPGNVHRLADFDDLCYIDFLLSAAAIGPILGKAPSQPVGQTILQAIRATRHVVATNTNLGIVLLLAPLAAAGDAGDLRTGVAEVLSRLTVSDSRDVFEAIRSANPGGLGTAPEQDVHDAPSMPLIEIMALGADRDLIARQYATGFRDVFEIGVPALREDCEHMMTLEDRVILTHLRFLAARPDTHIARVRGLANAVEASRRAALALGAGWPQTVEGRREVAELDVWMRQPGQRRNPGASADMVAASLFVALRTGIIRLPGPVAGPINHSGCRHER
jgi:triphosphoribosyl-dephospho-CoA synthase